MTIAELIQILSKADPKTKVTVWDPADDQMSDVVMVSATDFYPDHTWRSEEPVVLIASMVFDPKKELT